MAIYGLALKKGEEKALIEKTQACEIAKLQLQDEWTAKFVTLKSELDYLRGTVEGGFNQLAKEQSDIRERVEMLCDYVFVPTWWDRLAEFWWCITHWRKIREEKHGVSE